MKKFITIFLVLSFLALSGYLSAEKKGAELIIQKTDGQQARGELIAVKKDSLLLLSKSGRDETVNIRDIHFIKIAKRSKAVMGFFVGSLLGAAIGSNASRYDFFGNKREREDDKIMVKSVLICSLIGTGIGAASGTDKTIQFEDKSYSEIQEILEKLRKQARVKNYQ